ncbi:MAG: 30S ribosomal protein S7 [Candidatus Riflebacteria bacterium RBG_13_59_9]|nr:MAG: 30S ribosomal protein S7 [Candidatus Riflebacteria bacterium RBG_13_59_9]
MPRDPRKVSRHAPEPDPIYNSVLVAKFINYVMRRGKKSTAQRIFYDALSIIEKRTKGEEPAVKVFERAIQNSLPTLEVKSRRVGGATYQVPVEVRPERRYALAMRWLIGYAMKRSGKSFSERLANELMDASKGAGSAIKKRDDTHRMAEANRAFAQYRW